MISHHYRMDETSIPRWYHTIFWTHWEILNSASSVQHNIDFIKVLNPILYFFHYAENQSKKIIVYIRFAIIGDEGLFDIIG